MRVTTQMEQKLRQIAYEAVSYALEQQHGSDGADFSLTGGAPAYGLVQAVDDGFFVDMPIFVSKKAMEESK